MQSAANLSLPAIFEKQGDFHEMQGRRHVSIGKTGPIAITCMGSPYFWSREATIP